MQKGLLVCSGITFGCSLVITIANSVHRIGIDTFLFSIFSILGLSAVHNVYRNTKHADMALVYLMFASLAQSVKATFGGATYEMIRGIDFALIISKAGYLKLWLSIVYYNADTAITPDISNNEVCINFGHLFLFACYFSWLIRDEAVSGKAVE